jgi:hypothetical protein
VYNDNLCIKSRLCVYVIIIGSPILPFSLPHIFRAISLLASEWLANASYFDHEHALYINVNVLSCVVAVQFVANLVLNTSSLTFRCFSLLLLTACSLCGEQTSTALDP